MAAKASECLFCSPDPCECGARRTKKKAISVTQSRPKKVFEKPASSEPATVEFVAPISRTAAAMKAAAAKQVQEFEAANKSVKPVTSSPGAEFANAIKALAPILHKDERKKWNHLLGTGDVETRRTKWLEER